MNNKLNLRVATLLYTMAVSSLNVVSADTISSFNDLKSAIQNEETSVNVTGDIQFESSLTVDKPKEITGQNTSSSSFSPKTPPVPAENPYVAPAFNVYGGGNLTLKNLTVKNFGDGTAKTVISNSGNLNIGPGVTFENCKSNPLPGGRPYPTPGGIISNLGKMTIQTEIDGNVTFNKTENSGKANPDIMFAPNSSLDIKGEAGIVTFGNGVASYDASDTISITHSGTNSVVLKGDNGKYTGSYTNSDGSLTFDSEGNSFFGGKSEFTGGELKWENNKNNVFVNGSNLTINGANLTIGNGSDEAKLTTSNNVSIEGAKTININKNGELALGKNTTIFNASNGTNIKGSGKLSLAEGKNLSLAGQVIDEDADNLVFSSTDATVNIENVSKGAKELKVIAGDNAINSGLTINLKEYTSGEADVDITVDGSKIKSLNFEEGTNSYNGKITVQNSGVVTNKTGAKTTVSNDVSIKSTAEGTANSLVNQSGAELTISGSNGLTNKGKIDNKGTLNLNASVNTNDENGIITNTGSIVVSEGFLNKNQFTSTNSGSFSAKNLNNESGTFDMSQSSGEFTVTGNVQNSLGSILAKDATFGQYNDITGSGTSLTLDGTLTITGNAALSNVIENAGTIEAAVINVTAGGVTNSGAITAKTGDITLTNGDITNNDANGQITTILGSISAKNITNQGTIKSGKNITATGAVDNSKRIEATGTTTVNDKLTNNKEANLTTNGGTLNEVSNEGTITNQSGTLELADTFSGAGKLEQNGGELNVNASAAGFNGTFIQTAGTTNISDSSNIFGGEKNVNGGVFNVNSGELNYTGVVLGNNAEFNHKGKGGTINNSVLTFSGSNATAAFGSIGIEEFTLDSDITGTTDNNITFNNANLKLSGTSKEYNYGNFIFNNSTLKLSDSIESSIDSYTLHNFHSNNSSVDLKLEMKNDSGRYLDSDKLTFKENSNGNLKLGNVYIKGDRTVENGYDFNTKEDIITNQDTSSVKFDKTTPSVHIGSNGFTYDLDIQDKTVNLKVTGYADENTLYDVNKQSDTRRFFIDDTANDGVYNIGKSLDEDDASTGEGDFSIYGSHNGQESDTRNSVLSGALKSGSGNGSMFKIDDGTVVNFNISNLTIKEAQSDTRGGAVLYNESNNAKIVMDNLLITGNKSTTGKGGAIYNNGGQDDVGSAVFTAGLYVKGSTFEANSASDVGGAIYNDEKGYTLLEDIIVNAGSDTAKNDIYNIGFIETQGKNTFNSLYTNDDKGRSFFTGENTFSELVNKSTLGSLPAPNENYSIAFYGENSVTKSFDNQGSTINHSELEFNENSTFDNSGTFNNSAVLEFNGNDLTNTGTFDNEEYLYISQNSSVKGDSGNINNTGELDLEGDASSYTGNYTQTSDSEAITEVTGSFFGGTSTVDSGYLNWFTNKEMAEGSKLNISGKGTVLNIGNNDDIAGEITFKAESSITDGVITNIYKNSILNVDGGDVALSGDGAWLGKVELSDGKLTLNGTNNKYQEGSGILVANDGELNLEGLTVLHLGNGSSVERDVKTNIGKDSNVLLEEGEFTLDNGTDSSDTWEGAIVLDENSKGTLTFSGYNSSTGMGTLQADGGSINIVKDEVTGIGSNITFEGRNGEISGIGKNVKTNIDADSFVTLLEGGYLALNDDEENTSDIWQGQVNLQGGTLDYDMQSITGTLDAEKGNLNLLDGSILSIKEPSIVDAAVAVNIQKGATVEINEGAEFLIDAATEDKWNGTIKLEDGGVFKTDGIKNESGNGGGLQQSGGESYFINESDIHITDPDSYISGGKVSIKDKSSLSFGTGVQNLNVSELYMDGASTLGMQNGKLHDTQAGNLHINDTVNFTVDLNPRNHKGDSFIIDNLTTDGSGNLNISDFKFQGGAPIDRTIDFRLFNAQNTGDNITFDSTDKLLFTPIGYYGLKSLGEGSYRAFLDHYNPQVFRGQVATIAMYTSQLMVDDMVTNHFILHNERLVDNAKLANKYTAASALFNPYQKTYKEGGLWSKSYVSFDKMDLTHGLSVKNNIYGMLLGTDLPAIELKNNWEFIPTGYIGYNGGHQHFNGVSMYQNGGQLGAMGTFIKDKFIGSVTAYGGGYMNDMDVRGFNDNTGNWFAGTAAKAAYNYELFKDFTVQPNLFIAYNAFGKQNWGTDFGIMSMNSGMLNGVNVAPGLNLILQKNSWSLYGNISYMYFANDKIDGYAGNIHLPNVRMDHGYLQYGVGGTKVINDKLSAYGQINIRNAGINGIGFQAGINYRFDMNETAQNIAKGTKTAVNTMSNRTQETYVKLVKLFKKN